jgi:hypothetical protein
VEVEPGPGAPGVEVERVLAGGLFELNCVAFFFPEKVERVRRRREAFDRRKIEIDAPSIIFISLFLPLCHQTTIPTNTPATCSG